MTIQVADGSTAEGLVSNLKLVTDAAEVYIAAIHTLDAANTAMDGTSAAAATATFYAVLAAVVAGEAVNPYV